MFWMPAHGVLSHAEGVFSVPLTIAFIVLVGLLFRDPGNRRVRAAANVFVGLGAVVFLMAALTGVPEPREALYTSAWAILISVMLAGLRATE